MASSSLPTVASRILYRSTALSAQPRFPQSCCTSFLPDFFSRVPSTSPERQSLFSKVIVRKDWRVGVTRQEAIHRPAVEMDTAENCGWAARREDRAATSTEVTVVLGWDGGSNGGCWCHLMGPLPPSSRRSLETERHGGTTFCGRKFG